MALYAFSMASSSKKAVFYIALSLAQLRTVRSLGVEKAVDVRLRVKVSDDLETRSVELSLIKVLGNF